MGWVGFVLLGVMVLVVAVVTHGPFGWGMEKDAERVSQFRPWLRGESRAAHEAVVGGAAVAADDAEQDRRPRYQTFTYRAYSEERLPVYEALPGPPDDFAIKAAVFAAYRVAVADPRGDYAFTNFSRRVVFNLYLAFLLPLFTLAYGSAGIGAEREGRTLLWLTTRPLPRWAVYLAKLAGGLPWSVGVSVGAFVLLCLAGGDLGRRALDLYWPAVLGGAVAFTCLFHMTGALFRWPAIVGLVYVFFFETLVANLPGGLKQFSLNYYLKSLLFQSLTSAAPSVRPMSLETYQPAEPGTAWLVLLVVSVAVTALGAWLFGRQEPKDET
jgi:ABC-type transport system involved in multi-copper enzyme maturation permease subunit